MMAVFGVGTATFGPPTLFAVDALPVTPVTPGPDVPPAPVVPAPFEFSAGGATSWSLDPAAPSTADGGVSATYEGVILQVDHLTVLQSPIFGTPGNFPAEADLLPGEHGPAGGRVTIDTRLATLPTIGFKGLLTPTAIHIRRLPLDPARPKFVNFQVVLPDTGAFDGQLQTKDGWAPFRGWSERTEMLLEGDILTGSLANVRVVRIVLHGRLARADIPRRNAEITRLKADQTLPSTVEDIHEDAIAGHINAAQIVILLDAQGRPSASWTGGKVKGDLNFMNMRDLSATPSVPQPKPVP